ncbi:MAG: xanthine dehydrogenase family protein molybdopterin-binding subunit [Gammaproteobacteria bacterium]|jgi:isoquinoline 1-oxidoreductase subunit beta|nr:xanthine dehydrogenase family protein molybdopterin-binding subunit [Gammaproteobacteria bacterium]
MGKLTRRTFLISGAMLGGGALFGFIATPNRLGIRRSSSKQEAWLATWVNIAADNKITVLVPHAEMGQGTHTALPMMLAEEMEADWSMVQMQQAPAESIYAVGDMIKGFLADGLDVPAVFQRHTDYSFYKIASLMNMQITGGSGSVRFTGQAGMRRAGAAAKEMLIRAAAENWQVSVDECEAKLSQVFHHASGRSSSYGELAEQAASYEPPLHPVLKKKEDYTICGKPIFRFDTPAKVVGMQNYGIDIQLPGMKYAAIRHAPVFGGSAVSFDKSGIANGKGIETVVKLADSVVVIADNYWRAKTALSDLSVEFSDGEHGDFNSNNLFVEFTKALSSADIEVDFEQGEAGKELSSAAEIFSADYSVPFLAHATMEPMNCTAYFHDGILEIWTGTQDLLGARAFAAEVAELDFEKVIVHPVQLGGGFGRRLPTTGNYIEDAVRVAMQVSYPVKLIWSREEDMQHDYYRPAVQSQFKAILNSEGQPQLWHNVYTDIGINDDTAAAFTPYAIPHQSISRVELETPVPVSYWRSVEHSSQGFFLESFIDELAHKAEKDPFSYRLSLLKQQPRFAAALVQAAKNIGWEKNLPKGHGLGIAIKESFGTIVAQAVEVSLDDKDNLKIHRVSAVVDPGEVINPEIARSQIEGGIIYGLTAALFGKISVEKGRVIQSNFPDYQVLKLSGTPEIDVAFIESGERIGGMGEVGLPPIAAAVCNAIYAASGRRIRQLPLIDQNFNILA